MPDASTSDSDAVDADASRLHIEDRARAFACVYSRKPNRIGFAMFDRDANAIALAQISEEDGANETLGSIIHAASPDVAYVASRCKIIVDDMNADSRMTVVELPRRIFPGDKRQALDEMCDVARCEKTDLAAHVDTLESDDALFAAAGLLNAMRRNEGLALSLRVPPNFTTFDVEQYCGVDADTLTSLGVIVPEVFRNRVGSDEGIKKDISEILSDMVVTRGGKRLLDSWLRRPLRNIDTLTSRQDDIEAFMHSAFDALRKARTPKLDPHSFLSKMSGGILRVSRTESDWRRIVDHLRCVSRFRDVVDDIQSSGTIRFLPRAVTDFYDCASARLPRLRKLVEGLIDPDEMQPIGDDGMYTLYVRRGACPELDEMVDSYNSLPYLLKHVGKLEKARIPRFLRDGIENRIEMVYKPQCGYLIKCEGRAVPLAVCEEMRWKFVFAEGDDAYYEAECGLKLAEELGDVALSIVDLQERILTELRKSILAHATLLRDMARCVAEIDVLLALSDAAVAFSLVRPKLARESVLRIEDGRHLLYEQLIDGPFVPTTLSFEPDRKRVIVLTGANGSGKTVQLQTVGLIAYLAHVGSFVPAAAATVGLIDRIFTGMATIADDDIGETVEQQQMNQTARMFHNSTHRSLLLSDELGSRMSPPDGGPLLAAIISNYAEMTDPPCAMFSTHYRQVCEPEVCPLTPQLVHMRMRIIVKQRTNESHARVSFIYRIEPGVADDSYASAAMRRTGIPDQIVSRFEYLMERSERQQRGEEVEPLELVGDPHREYKLNLYRALVTQFFSAKREHLSNPANTQNIDNFIAFFESLNLDECGGVRVDGDLDPRFTQPVDGPDWDELKQFRNMLREPDDLK